MTKAKSLGWPVRLFEPTGLYQLILRRWIGSDRPDHRCRRSRRADDPCEAMVVVGEPEYQSSAIGIVHRVEEAIKLPCAGHWPMKCERCGRRFEPTDIWQEVHTEIYRCAETGEMTRINFIEQSKLPVGACWQAKWLQALCPNNGNEPHWPLVIVVPGGYEWTVDANSSDGGGWRRQDILNVHPSIRVPGYHGEVRDGFLTPNLD